MRRRRKNLYDAKIGKFWQIDPLTSDQPDVSPYAAMHNNPVSRVDPMGEWDDYFINQDGSIDKLDTKDNFDRFFLTDKVTPIAIIYICRGIGQQYEEPMKFIKYCNIYAKESTVTLSFM